MPEFAPEFTSALIEVFSPTILWWILVGFILGGIGGAIPGIGGELGIVLLIPFTLSMDPAAALVLLVASYSGSQYASTIPGVLMNCPGSPSSAAATLDGYPMARAGKAVTAISISGAASAFGALFGGVAVLLMFPILSQLVLFLGTPEFLMMSILGLATIAVASDRGVAKGLLVAAFGALLSTVGATPLIVDRRYAFGIPELYSGLSVIPMFIGMFAIAEMMRLARSQFILNPEDAVDGGQGSRAEGLRMTVKEWPTLIKASIIGLVVGIMPGQGGVVANFMAYIEAKQSSSEPERFGHGHPAGIVASDAANNAVVAGSLVPTLSFGIPGGSAAAVLLGAMMLHGLRPGPAMFAENVRVTYVLILSIAVSSIFILGIGSGLANILGRVPNIPVGILIPLVITVSLIGTYSIQNNYFHVWQALLFGYLGYYMEKFELPLVPFILGFILGPIAELNLYRTLLIGNGSLSIVLLRPGSSVLAVMTVLVLVWPSIRNRRRSQSLLQQGLDFSVPTGAVDKSDEVRKD